MKRVLYAAIFSLDAAIFSLPVVVRPASEDVPSHILASYTAFQHDVQDKN